KVYFLLTTEAAQSVLAELRESNSGTTVFGKVWKRPNGCGDHGPGFELYLGRRYFAVTGERLQSDSEFELPDIMRVVPLADLVWFVREFGPAFVGTETRENSSEATTNRARKRSSVDRSRSAVAYRKGVAMRRRHL